MSNTLADSHVHLDRYPAPTVTKMLHRARQAGVREFLAVGVDLASSEVAADLARRRRGVLAAGGVHPTRAALLNRREGIERLRAIATAPRVVAIGEVGLDDTAGGPSAQRACFQACLELARELQLPLALHVVGAHESALALLASQQPPGAVVHYFQGDYALARAYLELGCHISVGKPAIRPEARTLREAIRQIPLDRLMLETDTYPLPGRTTEPRDVAKVCQAVSELKGISAAEVARATTASFRRLFVRAGAQP